MDKNQKDPIFTLKPLPKYTEINGYDFIDEMNTMIKSELEAYGLHIDLL
jgi:hypothetical protein